MFISEKEKQRCWHAVHGAVAISAIGGGPPPPVPSDGPRPPRIYAVTETNVDGCGGDATEFVEFAIARPLSQEEYDLFRVELDQAKARARGNDDDTAAMIASALDAFQAKTGIRGRTVLAPIVGELTF